jgi:hypothetical protein
LIIDNLILTGSAGIDLKYWANIEIWGFLFGKWLLKSRLLILNQIGPKFCLWKSNISFNSGHFELHGEDKPRDQNFRREKKVKKFLLKIQKNQKRDDFRSKSPKKIYHTVKNFKI